MLLKLCLSAALVAANGIAPQLACAQAGGDAAMTAGVVRKVDKEAGKVTIRHEPLRNLDMPAMTMVFRVKDPAMLDQLKPGDKISFVADKVEGNFTVMRFEPAK
jgi:Cu(I)/Ag(I) efflux system protein CusF